jgi:hypothetical protein
LTAPRKDPNRDTDKAGNPLGLDHPRGVEVCDSCQQETDGNTHTMYRTDCCGDLTDHPDDECPNGCAGEDDSDG